MPHDLCIRELLFELVEQESESILLFRCAIVGRFAIGVDATYISHVDSCRVIALHSIANLFDGEELMSATIRCDDIVITWTLPSFTTELCLEIVDPAVQ